LSDKKAKEPLGSHSTQPAIHSLKPLDAVHMNARESELNLG